MFFSVPCPFRTLWLLPTSFLYIYTHIFSTNKILPEGLFDEQILLGQILPRYLADVNCKPITLFLDHLENSNNNNNNNNNSFHRSSKFEKKIFASQCEIIF